jgi:hypothetical protein
VKALPVVLVAACALALAGCGSKPQSVTKTQYEHHLDGIGRKLYVAANGLGDSTATGIFNAKVDDLEGVLDDAGKELDGLKLADSAAQAQNKRLARAYHDLADEFEKVKDARRESYIRALKALDAVQRSRPARETLKAAAQLRKLGIRVPVFAVLGSSA